jgi:branched-subunit amino acid permease
LCPCYVPVWRSQHPNKGFPSLLCCCPVLHDSTNSCIVDGLPREHLSILPMKTHKLHWLIHARFL